MKNIAVFFVFIILAFACKKHSTPSPPPGKAEYTFPTPDARCTPSGPVNDTLGTIDFYWKQAAYTDKYIVNLKNLLTNVVKSYPTNNFYETITLEIGTPYSWSITSVQSSTGAKVESDSWKFYVAGRGVVTYAPFPADLISPSFGEQVSTGTVTLKWQGNPVKPGSTLTYDVYFGMASNPPLQTSAVTITSLGGITVTSGNTYFWKIISKDTLNNSSESQIYQFEVQ